MFSNFIYSSSVLTIVLKASLNSSFYKFVILFTLTNYLVSMRQWHILANKLKLIGPHI